MTSQLCHNFKTSQTDDVTTPHFKSRVNYLSICSPQVDILNYLQMAGVPNVGGPGSRL